MFKKVLITSGPTIEPIDPIRFISNRSSGKTGYYLAVEAKNRGIPEIVFLTGPSHFIPPQATVIRVETALQMREQLRSHTGTSDVIIMAAAVGDYRPVSFQPEKIKKHADKLLLELVKNPDLLLEIGQNKRPGQILVGYAAETDRIFENAEKKLVAKNLDLLVLNQVSSENPAFAVDDNQVYLISRQGTRSLPTMTKAETAVKIWEAIDEIARLVKIQIADETGRS